jgi:Pyruvate/2-oxoacid:ferredoxin oxidoreductase gamma subunit
MHPEDIALKFAGAGGDGAQMIARLMCQIGINEGFDATYIPSYGPESRGGTSYADIHIAADEVLAPASPEPHGLIAFNAPSLDKFGPHVLPGGLIVYDETVIHQTPEVQNNVHMFGVPITRIAAELGNLKVKNTVALSAFRAASDIFPPESFLAALEQALHSKRAMLDLNQEAFARGQRAVLEPETA